MLMMARATTTRRTDGYAPSVFSSSSSRHTQHQTRQRTSHARQPATTSLVKSELVPPVPPHLTFGKQMKATVLRDHLTLYWQTYLVAFYFAALFLAVGLFQLRRLKIETDRYSWPRTTATIRSSRLEERHNYKRTGATVTATLWLDLTYSAGGLLYDRKLIQSFPGPLSVTLKDTFSADRFLTIQYNPQDPSEISIDPTTPPK